MAILNTQKILTGDKTLIDLTSGEGTSMTFSNSHIFGDVIIDLYMTSQIGTDITDTGRKVNLSAGYGITTSSQDIAVDGAAFINATCDYNNDPTITHDDDNGQITADLLVSGTGIPAGAYVKSVTNDTEFELSASTTGGSVTNGTLTFTNIATSDMFLDEQVWDEDGNLFGTCTAVHASGTPLTFGGGLLRKIFNNDDLYTGNRYYILRTTKIPRGTSFVLSSEEFTFDDAEYKMYINVDEAAGGIDIITR